MHALLLFVHKLPRCSSYIAYQLTLVSLNWRCAGRWLLAAGGSLALGRWLVIALLGMTDVWLVAAGGYGKGF